MIYGTIHADLSQCKHNPMAEEALEWRVGEIRVHRTAKKESLIEFANNDLWRE